MPSISYRSYAKINFYLDVLDRRADGFTNIETVFQSIDLWDRLDVETAPSGISVTCSNADLGGGPDNLVYRAAALVQRHAGTDAGVSIHLEKKLPIAAGLAGGSSNAAATLVALNELWSLDWSMETLNGLALELGSDVPFCLVGGTAAATGRGESLETLPPVPKQWLVLVHPPLAITAGYAYGHPQLTRNLEAPVGGKTPAFQKALAALSEAGPAAMVFNRMESGIFVDHPALESLKGRLMALGCTASAMSGSGPTVFGLCEDKNEAHAIAEAISDYRTSVVRTVAQGLLRE